IAEADLSRLGVPAARRATLHALARAVAGGTLLLDPGADRAATYQQLLTLPGVGEWTAGYILMRALGDPDTFLAGDLGIKKAGAPPAPRRNTYHPMLRKPAQQLEEYFTGTRTSFDLPLDLEGTRFQLAVWRSLADIPFGSTTTYGRQAAALGIPRAARAMGAANGANPVCIVLPCHRVIGADGSLTGFGGGLPPKQW